MKNLLLAGVSLLSIVACNKQIDVSSETEVTQADVNNAEAIAVGVTAGGDSIYLVNTCNRGQKRDSVAFSALPASITTYLTANYAGYVFTKSFIVKQGSNNNGYVVVINYNNKPVGLKFDASGNFVAVIEQRERRDIRGNNGWHFGGIFGDRDGKWRDTIALVNIPVAVRTYLATTYAGDTLNRAYRSHDSSIVVITTNNGVFANVFSASGVFIKRIQLHMRHGRAVAIDFATVPGNVQAYLSTTYPSYVLKHAFKLLVNATLQGYVIFIDANNTKYAVEFDASGTFVKAVTVR